MAIDDWAGTLKNILAEVSGIEQVHSYDELPGTISVFPTMIILPESGSQLYGESSPAIAIHHVKLTLFTSGIFLTESLGTAVPFIKLVRDKLAAHMKLEGTVAYCLPVSPPESWYEGPLGLSYGAKVHTGINFHLLIKEVETLSVSQ